MSVWGLYPGHVADVHFLPTHTLYIVIITGDFNRSPPTTLRSVSYYSSIQYVSVPCKCHYDDTSPHSSYLSMYRNITNTICLVTSQMFFLLQQVRK